ncbi:MAG: acetyl-CoA hydrolase [Thermoleophilia bacterium]|nr:acetyl-CoA hydrolase [Thermoleophilia bacterium]
MDADAAAALIPAGANVGMSGFTGAGHAKAVPSALARRIRAAHAAGTPFRVGVWTGASTAHELDGALAEVDGIDLRMPYQSDPVTRAHINDGSMEYVDVHLSHVAQMVREGFFGTLDVAVIEVSSITEDGRLVMSSSVGNNVSWIENADALMLEVNHWQSEEWHGLHDLYLHSTLPPHRRPLLITHAGDRIGEGSMPCPLDKVIAVVETHAPDANPAPHAPDAASEQIAGHLLELYRHEVRIGRLPAALLPLQSGVGNVTNAVLRGMLDGGWRGLTAYTEVIQESMLELLDAGVLDVASASAMTLGPEAAARFNDEVGHYRGRIVLRPQAISNHPEIVRRLGVLATNGMIEADIYGNVNSTHLMGSRMMNGIGGSGDFARNAFLSCFVSASTAKGGTISTIVPMVSHVDHTEHDVHVIITEQGIADLRGLPPRRRARLVIDNCAHPDFRAELHDYVDRATHGGAYGLQTPHLLGEALSWHQRFVETGTMRR